MQSTARSRGSKSQSRSWGKRKQVSGLMVPQTCHAVEAESDLTLRTKSCQNDEYGSPKRECGAVDQSFDSMAKYASANLFPACQSAHNLLPVPRRRSTPSLPPSKLGPCLLFESLSLSSILFRLVRCSSCSWRTQASGQLAGFVAAPLSRNRSCNRTACSRPQSSRSAFDVVAAELNTNVESARSIF